MRTVLLVNPPVWFADGEPHTLDTEYPPLGLLYIAAWLRRYTTFVPRVVDVAPQGLTLSDLAGILRRERPFAVGIAAMTLQLQGAVEVATVVRREAPRCPIFLGGNHVSGDPTFVERNADLFDHGITREGERTFADALNRLEAGESLPVMLEGEPIGSLDDLPFPDRTLIDRRRYLRPEYLMASRGCPFHCDFCATPALAGPARRRSASDVLEEIASLVRVSRGRLAFQDDNFTADRDFVFAFCEGVRSRGWSLRWICSSRIDLVDEELVRSMKQAGCEGIHFGIESGSERLRAESMHKRGFDNARIRETIRCCRTQGVRANGFFILGAPGESVERLEETEDLILHSGLSAVVISLPLPFPGSGMYERAKRAGVIDEDFLDRFARKALGAGITGVYPLYLESLDHETVSRAMRRLYRRFYLRPEVALDWIRRDLASPRVLVQDLRSGLHLLARGTSCRKPFE
ncbi:MAG: radical SAM protein [Deltaproteobacteria bacterium]|nr:radical SAM protein [Deltaproteobacteria bacterium]